MNKTKTTIEAVAELLREHGTKEVLGAISDASEALSDHISDQAVMSWRRTSESIRYVAAHIASAELRAGVTLADAAEVFADIAADDAAEVFADIAADDDLPAMRTLLHALPIVLVDGDDGEEINRCTFGQFIADNSWDADEAEEIARALSQRGKHTMGGGAAPLVRIEVA